MDFDYFYNRRKDYFGEAPSDGVVAMLKEYAIKPCKALDLGAGEGRNAIYLASLGFDVCALEPTKEGANVIKENANKLSLNIEVKNMDYLEDNSNDKYDFILAGTSLDHMDYDYLMKAITKLKDSLNIGGMTYIVVFTEKDPGYLKDKENASECATFIKHYFKLGELKSYFQDFEILFYNEYEKEDTSHGNPHYHGKAKIIARKR